MFTNWTESNVSSRFDAYDDWVENCFGYQPLIFKLISDLGRDSAVLDYGCGSGKVSRRLMSSGVRQVTGVDIAPVMVNKAKQASGDRERYFQIDSGRVPFSDSSFDAAISSFVFINIPSKQGLLDVAREIARVLKPGGVFYILDTNPNTLGCQFPTYMNGYGGSVYRDGGDRRVQLRLPDGTKLDLVDKNWALATYYSVLDLAGFSSVKATELEFHETKLDPRPNDYNSLHGKTPFVLFEARSDEIPADLP